jgi:hypothetical protein
MSDLQPSDPFSPGSSTPPRRGGAFFGVSSDGKTRWERRKDRIRSEIERNRAGDYKVPTWVLTAILVAVVVGFGLFIAFA